MSELRVTDLSFAYANDEQVLRGVNLHCESGSFSSLLGASGCGKSTLLRLLAGLAKPDSGELSVPDDEVSFIFQRPTLCPWMTVRKNIALPSKLRGVPAAERLAAANESIELVGLTQRDGDKLPHQLSGGMQMRVSLARALTTRPRIMLMDEPFSALDEVLRQQLAEKCLDLWNRQKWTTLFVTHNVHDAVFMSQKIHIIAGSPARIVDTIDVKLGTRNEDLRTSAEFLELVAHVGKQLRIAVDASQNRSAESIA